MNNKKIKVKECLFIKQKCSFCEKTYAGLQQRKALKKRIMKIIRFFNGAQAKLRKTGLTVQCRPNFYYFYSFTHKTFRVSSIPGPTTRTK